MGRLFICTVAAVRAGPQQVWQKGVAKKCWATTRVAKGCWHKANGKGVQGCARARVLAQSQGQGWARVDKGKDVGAKPRARVCKGVQGCARARVLAQSQGP
eukprot:1154884-Pelagomonas_calceolata.AAC.5